jgi:lipoyl(octanoyl) transferase
VSVVVKQLGLTDYQATWHAMQIFTAGRQNDTPDELWLTEHAPVYTLGLNKKDVKLPLQGDIPSRIPIIQTDRGGKITYHGPGQMIVYLLLDLKRRGINVRQLVSQMEDAVIALLAEHNIQAIARSDAPGVYVAGRKIASLGLRLKNGCCYHGLSLNVDMDLSPFNTIDPCGYQGMEVTQMRDLATHTDYNKLATSLLRHLAL